MNFLADANGFEACKLVFIASSIGSRDLSSHIKALISTSSRNPVLPELRRVVCIGNGALEQGGVEMQSYSTFTSNGHSVFMNDHVLKRAKNAVTPEDVLNLQFTSGTATCFPIPHIIRLTPLSRNHRFSQSGHVDTQVSPLILRTALSNLTPSSNLLNNARFVGDAMALTPEDVICCPPPLFHCFGLVLGFLASFTHGSSIVFPSDFFDVRRVVDAIVDEDATVLLGVPTMYVSELEVIAKTGQRPRRLRTGLASGSAVSQGLMNELRAKMGVEKMLIAYGMTETSPVTFITSLSDSDEKGTTTVGKVMPHTAAKVVGKDGRILGRGERGELCTSGFALQKGYLGNEEKTREVMRRDGDGVLWMHTGDEALLDEDGYAQITGRIKDMIIRGEI